MQQHDPTEQPVDHWLGATIWPADAYREQLRAVGISVEEVPENLLDLLDQDEWWRPKGSPPVRVADMESGHRRNLIGWLERRAEYLHFREGLRMVLIADSPIGPSGDMACDAFDAALDEQERMPSAEWLNDKPLMRRLRELEGRHVNQKYDPNVIPRTQDSPHPPPLPAQLERRVVEAATIRPGDHIVVAIPDHGDPDGLRHIANELRERFPDNNITLVNAYGIAVQRADDAEVSEQDGPCPTCSGPIRETVGMVCQTCGTDYGEQQGAVSGASEHTAVECKGCDRGCMFCEGGLFACSVCHSFEGATTTDCPGERMTSEQSDEVYAGRLDFRDGEWRTGECSRHTPAYWETAKGVAELERHRAGRNER